ncbi:DUF1836 domain-containing protein [bacterium]|nr:DUF1836 domain-containing protein [bacterium]
MKDVFVQESELGKRLVEYRLPRYNELSEFDIYMAQLTAILDKYLAEFLIPGEEKTLTASMINNYVQKGIIKAPVNKKYSRLQIIHLLVIGILKQVLSISEIAELIQLQIKRYPIRIAYDYFCDELENALNVTFETRSFSDIKKRERTTTLLSENVRSAVIAFANRIYVKKSLYLAKIEREKQKKQNKKK